jgi:hypothetical protein
MFESFCNFALNVVSDRSQSWGILFRILLKIHGSCTIGTKLPIHVVVNYELLASRIHFLKPQILKGLTGIAENNKESRLPDAEGFPSPVS